MTPQDIGTVASSLERLDLDSVAAAFYERLFVAHPELRSLFPTDVRELQWKFAVELRAIVAAISDLDQFVERTRELGNRHATYGVATSDYGHVGSVLMDTLAAALPGEPDTVAAWRSAYAMVAEAMLEGADANPFAAEPAS